VLKLFMSGHGEASFSALREYDLFGWLFPDSNIAISSDSTDQQSAKDRAKELIQLALASTDRRIANGQPVTPAFIYAAFLWYPFLSEQERLVQEGSTNLAAFHEAASNVVAKQQLFTSIPRRFSGPMRDIWQLQSRLPIKFGKKPEVLMEHRRFRAAYDFLLIREASGEHLDGLGEWWTKYQEEAPDQRQEMTSNEPKPKRKRKRRRRRPRKPQ